MVKRLEPGSRIGDPERTGPHFATLPAGPPAIAIHHVPEVGDRRLAVGDVWGAKEELAALDGPLVEERGEDFRELGSEGNGAARLLGLEPAARVKLVRPEGDPLAARAHVLHPEPEHFLGPPAGQQERREQGYARAISARAS